MVRFMPVQSGTDVTSHKNFEEKDFSVKNEFGAQCPVTSRPKRKVLLIRPARTEIEERSGCLLDAAVIGRYNICPVSWPQLCCYRLIQGEP